MNNAKYKAVLGSGLVVILNLAGIGLLVGDHLYSQKVTGLSETASGPRVIGSVEIERAFSEVQLDYERMANAEDRLTQDIIMTQIEDAEESLRMVLDRYKSGITSPADQAQFHQLVEKTDSYLGFGRQVAGWSLKGDQEKARIILATDLAKLADENATLMTTLVKDMKMRADMEANTQKRTKSLFFAGVLAAIGISTLASLIAFFSNRSRRARLHRLAEAVSDRQASPGSGFNSSAGLNDDVGDLARAVYAMRAGAANPGRSERVPGSGAYDANAYPAQRHARETRFQAEKMIVANQWNDGPEPEIELDENDILLQVIEELRKDCALQDAELARYRAA